MLAATLGLGSLACGGQSGVATTATTATTPDGTASAGGITLQILAPAEGATVTNPFTLRVEATGIQIAPASAQVPGAAHYHAFLDADPVAEGKLIPSGAGIFHFTDPVQLRAGAGEHSVTVVLGDNGHVRLKGAPAAKVTFSVGPNG